MVVQRSDRGTALTNGVRAVVFIPTHPISDVLGSGPRSPMDLVTGDAPQPGETPRTEGNPWSFDPDAAWWRGDADRDRDEALAEAAARPRHPRRRPAPGSTPATPSPSPGEPAFAEEALDAHAAGAHDAAEALEDTPATDTPTVLEDTPATQAGVEPAATAEQAEVAETVTEELTEPEPAAVER